MMTIMIMIIIIIIIIVFICYKLNSPQDNYKLSMNKYTKRVIYIIIIIIIIIK
jgi:hypothetical protein